MKRKKTGWWFNTTSKFSRWKGRNKMYHTIVTANITNNAKTLAGLVMS